ncbi:hypothetical protein L3Q82_016190 [Scortum barcoo]|uniref:Uncharacterized protein n=1 Tax=Scortum barcoo TaxID=214431 RepID=A0ACB8VSC3_9TELE|nr:hypothetical protein L3Q82_016190 [Scortum barcoo]
MAAAAFLLAVILWMMPHMGAAAVLSSSTDLLNTTGAGAQTDLRVLSGALRSRRKRGAISSREINALLDYHNRVRSQVFPPAANMEFMVWDEGLAKSADSWASRCIWDHGPTQAIKYMGQNLSVTSGRYQSITDLVKSWYEERHHFSYPNRCSGYVCSHYTQMVWASTSRMGCAVRKCSSMYVFGSTWQEATLLVCNYSINYTSSEETSVFVEETGWEKLLIRAGSLALSVRPATAAPAGGTSAPRTPNPKDFQDINETFKWIFMEERDYPRVLWALTAGLVAPGKQHYPVTVALLLLPACLSLAGPKRAAEAHGPSLSWPAHCQGSAFRGMYGQDGTLHFANPGKGKRETKRERESSGN